MAGRIGSSSGILGRSINASLSRRGAKNFDWYRKAQRRDFLRYQEKLRQDALPQLPPAQGPRSTGFLDFTVGGAAVGRVEFRLADDIMPRTCENFMTLIDGSLGFGYQNTIAHRIIKNTCVVMGDVENTAGKGGHSAFGSRYFEDESFVIRHTRPGVLSMVSAGVDRNASQFLINLDKTRQYDGRLVGFGEVTSGLDVVFKLNEVFTMKQTPMTEILIADCGRLGMDELKVSPDQATEELVKWRQAVKLCE